MDEENQEILSEFRTIELTHNQRSIFGLNTARKLIFESDDTQITLQHSKVIDNGPFYQRYISDAIMKRSGGLESSQGFGEYIKPERIYDRKYWWMVKMRLRFMDLKPHWVQRLKRMYEWTW
jgi:carotenoid 1,2-hydratase